MSGAGNTQRNYVPFDPAEGFPGGERIHYECVICRGTVASIPAPGTPTACRCRNVRVDPDAGRVSVRDESAMKVFVDNG